MMLSRARAQIQKIVYLNQFTAVQSIYVQKKKQNNKNQSTNSPSTKNNKNKKKKMKIYDD